MSIDHFWPRENPTATHMVQPDRRLGELMSSWHSSMGDPIYAVSSNFFAGHPVPIEVAERALARIRMDRAVDVERRKYNGWGRKEMAELKVIDERLGKLIASASKTPQTHKLIDYSKIARENPTTMKVGDTVVLPASYTGFHNPVVATVVSEIRTEGEKVFEAEWTDASGKEWSIWFGFNRGVISRTPDSATPAIRAAVSRKVIAAVKARRNNPSTQSLDRSVQADLNALQGFVPEGHYGDAKHILTWLHRNEMDSIATYFVDSMKKGRDKFVRDFHLDKKVLGGMFSAKAGKAEVVKSLKNLKEASWASVRENPSTGVKMVVAGTVIAGLAGIVLVSRSAAATTTSTTTPVIGPQPPSNVPTAPPPETEIVVTSPPPGSPPDAPPVEHVVPTNGSAPAPEPPAVQPPPPSPPGAPPPPPTTTPPVAGSAPHTGLVSRLSTSDTARQVFVFQALCYEWSVWGAVPDGLLGPITAGMIREIDRQYGIGTPSGTFRGATTIRRLTDVIMRTNAGGLPTPRLLPFTLPRNVIAQVNATGTRIGSPILLQIHAA